MSFLVKEKSFYKLLVSVALPVALQNFLTFAITMIDTLMIGALGDVELSSAALANQFFFIHMVTIFGVGSGASVLVAQYWGKRDSAAISRIFFIAYKAALAISFVVSVLAVFFPEKVMSLYTPDQDVIALGAEYMRICGAVQILFGLQSVTTLMLRAMQSILISVVVNITSLLINGFLNWVLIFGNLSAPAMGVKGAAVATAIARIVEFLLVFIYIMLFEKKIHLKLSSFFQRNRTLARDFFVTASPVILNEMLWSTGVSVISMIVGRIGTETVAANSITSVVYQVMSVIIFGLSNGSGVIIGNAIGAGETVDGVMRQARTLCVLSAVFGVMSGAIIFLARHKIVLFYNVSQLTRDIAVEIMGAYAILAVFQSIAHLTLIGLLRAGGDAKFVLFADVAFLWTVAIPLGYIAAFRFHAPVAIVFLCLKSDELIKSCCSLLRVRSRKWISDLTR